MLDEKITFGFCGSVTCGRLSLRLRSNIVELMVCRLLFVVCCMLLQIGTQNIVTHYVQAVGLSFKGLR